MTNAEAIGALRDAIERLDRYEAGPKIKQAREALKVVAGLAEDADDVEAATAALKEYERSGGATLAEVKAALGRDEPLPIWPLP